MPPVPVGTSLYGGRLVPRSVVLGNPRGLLGVNVDRSVVGEEVDNAVLPAWREALLDVVLVV